jgi:hypothetical protein
MRIPIALAMALATAGHQRHDRNLPDAARAEGMPRVWVLDHHRLDHQQVRGDWDPESRKPRF